MEWKDVQDLLSNGNIQSKLQHYGQPLLKINNWAESLYIDGKWKTEFMLKENPRMNQPTPRPL